MHDRTLYRLTWLAAALSLGHHLDHLIRHNAVGWPVTDQVNFGDEVGRHPPIRGWLAVPLIGSDGANYGFIQASDRLEGDFTEQDEVNLMRLASLTSTALDALAQLHLPAYRAQVTEPPP
jgi:hypothetical protein